MYKVVKHLMMNMTHNKTLIIEVVCNQRIHVSLLLKTCVNIYQSLVYKSLNFI